MPRGRTGRGRRRAREDAVTADNPYGTIIARNVFGLLPPPTNPPDQKPPDPPVKITPNGIMNIFGQWQVLFKTTGGAKPGQPAKDQSYMLSEGQQEDDIEVVKIDQKASIVTLINHGIEQKLPLANTPASNASAPAPGGAPGQSFPNFPGRPGIGGGSPGGSFTTFGGGTVPFGGRNTFGNRGNPGGASGGNGGNIEATPNNLNAATSDKYAIRMGANVDSYSPLPPEQQMVITAAQHLKAIQEGSPLAPLYPSTPLDRPAGITQDPADGGSPPAP